MTDGEIIEAASAEARRVESGGNADMAVQQNLRAAIATRTEADRHRLARQSLVNAGTLGEVALYVLRVAIFGLPRGAV